MSARFTPDGLTALGLPKLASVLAELREEEIDPTSETGRRTLELWFGAPTEQVCRRAGCATPLRRFEVLNGGTCWPCTEHEIRRIAATRGDSPRYAR